MRCKEGAVARTTKSAISLGSLHDLVDRLTSVFTASVLLFSGSAFGISVRLPCSLAPLLMREPRPRPSRTRVATAETNVCGGQLHPKICVSYAVCLRGCTRVGGNENKNAQQDGFGCCHGVPHFMTNGSG